MIPSHVGLRWSGCYLDLAGIVNDIQVQPQFTMSFTIHGRFQFTMAFTMETTATIHNGIHFCGDFLTTVTRGSNIPIYGGGIGGITMAILIDNIWRPLGSQAIRMKLSRGKGTRRFLALISTWSMLQIIFRSKLKVNWDHFAPLGKGWHLEL